MGIAELFSVLVLRKFLVAWTVVVCVAAATAVGVFLPERYVAAATVQIDSVQRNTLTGLVEPRVKIAEFLGQQAAFATSRTVALDVIDRLTAEGFISMQDFETRWREETGGELVAGNDARLWAADELLEQLRVEADALESTLKIHFRAETAEQAARVANAFANAYVDKIGEQRQRRAAQKALSFTQATQSLADDLEDAQRDLIRFRERSGILPLGEQQVEASEVELASLSARLAEARADNAEAQSLLRKAENTSRDNLVTFPLPEDSIPGRQAQARLTVVNAQLARIAERYGSTYPDYVETAQEKRALEENILNAIRARADYAARRAGALEESMAALKGDVIDLQGTRQTYDLLRDKVVASQETFNLVAMRSMQETLQSQVDSIHAIPLARAVPPTTPATPPLFVIVILGVVFGVMMGASAATCLEFYEGRVRSAKSVQQIFQTPVVNSVELFAMPKRKRRPHRRMEKAA